MYTNDSYSAEKAYDNFYERSEDIRMKECPDCDGEGFELFSECCGAEIRNMNECTDCGNICVVKHEDCHMCNGEGEVSA